MFQTTLVYFIAVVPITFKPNDLKQIPPSQVAPPTGARPDRKTQSPFFIYTKSKAIIVYKKTYLRKP
ncbi:hypothetical protein PUN28_006446 [Cardiocondyla obscurior]|uniref:ATP synthase F0 subunit 8 n=1 Tax=Cardiocondyla obscurior TaxID=286306 RepID=A0AAW2GB81_9HYME